MYVCFCLSVLFCVYVADWGTHVIDSNRSMYRVPRKTSGKVFAIFLLSWRMCCPCTSYHFPYAEPSRSLNRLMTSETVSRGTLSKQTILLALLDKVISKFHFVWLTRQKTIKMNEKPIENMSISE